MSEELAYLGKGWSFPLDVNFQGQISLSSEGQLIKEAIRIILGTKLGERVYRPNFGCRLSELLFAPMDTKTLYLVRFYVQEALEMWEPRIDLEEILVEPNSIIGRLDIVIEYRIKQTYQPDSIVYPFYLQT